jgi:SpoVK/Ycf46/Vps4 family AAA+-type ATPase
MKASAVLYSYCHLLIYTFNVFEFWLTLLLNLAHVEGVLLYGPPGTGKTLLARAVTHHIVCTFIRVSGSELVQKYIGEGSRMVRELFVMARFVSLFV